MKIASSHRARKRFGQHFLTDPGVINQLVAAINPQPGEHLIEIGPGQGAMTAPLLQHDIRLDVIELDRDLIPELQQRWPDRPNFHVHQADALKFDYRTLAADGAASAELRLTGNLPYNISTPLLFHVLEQAALFRDMHFMLQKEVVMRLTAVPGNKNYGRLSVMTALYCEAWNLFSIGPEAFSPPPKVDSAMVRLIPRAKTSIPATQIADFGALVRLSFSQRRKTLRNNLKGLLDDQQIKLANIDPGCRAETLGLEQFLALYKAHQQATSGNSQEAVREQRLPETDRR
jgi:16S rRNA (adenine1518-N6/adenine1519-N6)-dimethyltransferase